jgi:hypothetical protein
LTAATRATRCRAARSCAQPTEQGDALATGDRRVTPNHEDVAATHSQAHPRGVRRHNRTSEPMLLRFTLKLTRAGTREAREPTVGLSPTTTGASCTSGAPTTGPTDLPSRQAGEVGPVEAVATVDRRRCLNSSSLPVGSALAEGRRACEPAARPSAGWCCPCRRRRWSAPCSVARTPKSAVGSVGRWPIHHELRVESSATRTGRQSGRRRRKSHCKHR